MGFRVGVQSKSTGEVVHYKYYCVPFGSYCQISKEDSPRNSMLARTEGAIALGPSGNVQGAKVVSSFIL